MLRKGRAQGRSSPLPPHSCRVESGPRPAWWIAIRVLPPVRFLPPQDRFRMLDPPRAVSQRRLSRERRPLLAALDR
jgi:hypothetical protein